LAPADGGRNTHIGARRLLGTIAGGHTFYSLLSAEELGRTTSAPVKPSPLTVEERAAARITPGFVRAMLMFKLGLRTEAVKEWNYTTGFGRLESDSEGPTAARALSDRQLLAAAQWACEQEIWDRCIQAADRTREEIDLELRFPTPFRQEVVETAKAAKLDTAYMYGLIRQESRFILEARSHAGASGLMQLMPNTAKWTARKMGLAFKHSNIHEPQTNIQLGAGFLRLTLNNFGGSQAIAAAAYNAGPTRARRWREDVTMDAAAWVESIPFTETRDYVKKLLTNAWAYQIVLTGKTSPLRTRLGERIGPKEPNSPPPDPDMP
jgi:soluble lytic murein transglycosylase